MPLTEENMANYRKLADRSHELVGAFLAEKDPIKKQQLGDQIKEFSPGFVEAIRACGENNDVV
jgi:hypothetical protein